MPEPQTGDWVTQLTDTIERTVATVRERTTVPAILVARAVVYGLMVAVLGVVALVLLIIAFVRLLDNYLPGGVWLPYLITGTVFCVVGAVLMHKRHPRAVA